jgi:hypothetical protein
MADFDRMAWEMRVREVFRLSDGRTVFVGPMTSDPPFVTSAVCDLIVEGAPVGDVAVSEDLPERREPSSSGDRALSTHDDLDVTAQTVRDRDVRLRKRPS